MIGTDSLVGDAPASSMANWQPVNVTCWRQPADVSAGWTPHSTELGRLHRFTLAARPAGWSRPPPSPPAQRELFAATGIAPPPRVTSLQPA
jgi:hypothetical protein